MEFSELFLKHKSAVAVVMGGAPSLADDIASLPKGRYFWLSANEHGAKARAIDYFVAMDTEHGRERKPMDQVLRPLSDAPILSPELYADCRIYGWPGSPRRIYTGMVAAWCAWVMGAKAVLLAGFDGYGQQPGYQRKARQFYVDAIQCPVREIGGRLKVWPAYDPDERFRFRLAPKLVTFMGGDGWTWVRATKRTMLESGRIDPGEVRRVRRDGAFIRNLMQHGILQEIDEPRSELQHGKNQRKGAQASEADRRVAIAG